jgi:hypothetical protein
LIAGAFARGNPVVDRHILERFQTFGNAYGRNPEVLMDEALSEYVECAIDWQLEPAELAKANGYDICEADPLSIN